MAQQARKFLSTILLTFTWLVSATGALQALDAKGSQEANVTVKVSCNQVFADISFDGEPYAASLVVTFSNPLVTLLPGSLDITATLIDPTDPALRARLPEGLFIPGRFPVLIEITPRAILGLAFLGDYRLDLETDNLEFDRLVPYRLLRAETGQGFDDMTRNLGIGSYRVRGMSGAFSEFVLAADLRSTKKVVESKIAQLRGIFENRAGDIDSTLLTDFKARVDAIEQDCLKRNYSGALSGVDDLLDAIEAGVAAKLVDDLFNSEDPVSTSGLLLGAAWSTRLTMVLARQSLPPETSVRIQRFQTPNGRRLQVRVSLTGAHSIDLDDLLIQAYDIDPFDPVLLARLPSGVSIPEDFPVMVKVTPGSTAEQAFRGGLMVEVETNDLTFLPDSPLRLFKAVTQGSPFRDITGTTGVGSYRVRGMSGAFSEFLIVEDPRPIEAVNNGKFDVLEGTLQGEQGRITDPSVFNALVAKLSDARNAFNAGDPGQADDKIKDFLDIIEDNAGEAIGDIWHITDGRVNSAAILTRDAQTLKFGLTLEDGPLEADPADVNRDGKIDVQDVFAVIDRVYGGAN